jgi:putative transposase
MPRPRRYTPAGEIFHVVNRGNDKRVIFANDANFQRFLDFMDECRADADVAIVGYCLMRTHFHLMLCPGSDKALPAYMHRLTSRYARYLRKTTATEGHGHIFKERYWAEGMRDFLHLLTVLAYVEGNALQAGLVTRAEDWRWGSLRERRARSPELIDPTLVALPSDWSACVNLSRSDRFRALAQRLLWFPRPRW